MSLVETPRILEISAVERGFLVIVLHDFDCAI
jgi:hypothetical protein